MITILIVLTLGLAFANGANDISKGIATLVGSGVTNFRSAVIWGSCWTVAGGLVAAIAAQSLVQTFNGSGVLKAVPTGYVFLSAVAVGAVAWVLFASVTGMPVSTTHAIIGALCGAGIVAGGMDGVKWVALRDKVALPLAVSPFVSLGLMWLLFPLLRLVASRLGSLDRLHWLSAGATSFARGLNDTPKVLALGVAAAAATGFSVGWFYVGVAVAMGVGSVVAGLRVTETLARKVTPMNPTEGFAANLITALLVGVASRLGLPVSTTHVSSSAILGIGLHHDWRQVRWKTVGEMLLAWVVTLPVAALLAAGAYAIFR